MKYIYYTDGIINLRVKDGTPCPEGFHRGRVTKQLSEEEQKRANEKRKKTSEERYGNPTYNNTEKRKKTNLEKYGTEFGFQNDEVKEKIKQTNLEKYGVENQFQRTEYIKESLQQKYGTEIENISQTDFCKEKVRETNLQRYNSESYLSSEQLKQYYLETYGVDSFVKTKDFIEKQSATKTKNRSFNTSLPEELYYIKLVEQFGENDVYRQYSDDRYPYACDFYIKSTDTFIELNLTWTHGKKPFEGSEEDLKILSVWQEKAKTSDYYKNAIETWTIRDVNKRNIAIQNNLNYIIYYSTQELIK